MHLCSLVFLLRLFIVTFEVSIQASITHFSQYFCWKCNILQIQQCWKIGIYSVALSFLFFFFFKCLNEWVFLHSGCLGQEPPYICNEYLFLNNRRRYLKHKFSIVSMVLIKYSQETLSWALVDLAEQSFLLHDSS